MPHSLRVRLKNLQRKGELTEKDIDRIFKALEQEIPTMIYPQVDGITPTVVKVVKAEQESYICDSCQHKDDSWDTEPCDGCCGNHSGYEPQERSE